MIASLVLHILIAGAYGREGAYFLCVCYLLLALVKLLDSSQKQRLSAKLQ